MRNAKSSPLPLPTCAPFLPSGQPIPLPCPECDNITGATGASAQQNRRCPRRVQPGQRFRGHLVLSVVEGHFDHRILDAGDDLHLSAIGRPGRCRCLRRAGHISFTPNCRPSFVPVDWPLGRNTATADYQGLQWVERGQDVPFSVESACASCGQWPRPRDSFRVRAQE